MGVVEFYNQLLKMIRREGGALIYALTVITIFQSIIKISRKKSSYIILLIMMLVISMGNYFNADYLVYERMYNNAEYSRLEPVFSLLMALGRTIGLSYHQFAVMVILIGFIIILSSIKNKNITNYVLLAYLFYPFLLDVTQIRFF